MDRQDLFLHFVSRVEVPDYCEVIKEPMCWTLIDEKIEQNEYRRIEDFKVDLSHWIMTDKQHDINLVLDNALKYNAPDSTFHRIAKRIQANSRELLAELDQLAMPGLSMNLVNGDRGQEEIGDLEPSRHFLEVLISQSGDIHHRDRLASLFAFDLEPPKEPTPPPPPPVPVKKRENYADRKRKWEEKEARHLERLESGRSTRAGQAKEEAFQHEAGLLPPLPAAPQAEAGPSTRRTRHSMGNSSSEISKTLGLSSSSSASRPVRSQVGVAGREIIERLSDKERRAREQGLNLEIEAVDNSDQFTRFNTGWILPEGSRRRKPNDSPAVPLKPRVRKRELIPIIVINRS
jgi:NuA3 HAT complex component NTO1